MNIQTTAAEFTDKRWRLNNLYHIIDKAGKQVQFRMNWAQEGLFDDMDHLNVVLKARQLGFSTFIQLYMLDDCIFVPNLSAGVIAHNREDAEAMFQTKIRYPYDKLPVGLREANPALQESTRQLRFQNNSSIRVGTSHRSGTLQILHVSEYGKLCAKYPEKAREVKTGALNTVQAGQTIFVESTAEGQEGDFFNMCQRAQELLRTRAKITPLDFKFHFYPWWQHPEYEINPDGVVIPQEYENYFKKLADQGIELSPSKKAWYVKKADQQEGDMKREYPSTPEEAFEASIEGAYYSNQMAKAETQGRICHVPHQDGVKVETWWDLGFGDVMSIGWVQRVGQEIHVIDYYENSGEGLAHYAAVLQEKQRERGLVYGEHVWPHDGNVHILDEKGRKRTEVMRDLGYHMSVVERGKVDTGIEQVRNMLGRCWFDEARCRQLVRALKSYRKDWDENLGTWKPNPRHDWASHPADMIRTGAMHRPAKPFAKINTAPPLAVA